MELPSADLLRRWQREHDLDALDELLRFEVALLRERLRRRRGDRGRSATVSDVAQEATMAWLASKSSPVFEEPAALRAYLLRVANRLLVRRSRAVARERVARGSDSLDRLPSPIEELSEPREEMRLAMEFLRPEEREILDLVYGDRLRCDEAARRLGITHAAARKRLERARRALAERMSAWARVVAPLATA
ncbi:MAG: sigma-70 family RNA polymerase sigma factor [Planctomycetes bacterium]|nr:sigma-70 family RNA polymerase sigma factor [Planctomycetota bacterium]